MTTPKWLLEYGKRYLQCLKLKRWPLSTLQEQMDEERKRKLDRLYGRHLK